MSESISGQSYFFINSDSTIQKDFILLGAFSHGDNIYDEVYDDLHRKIRQRVFEALEKRGFKSEKLQFYKTFTELEKEMALEFEGDKATIIDATIEEVLALTEIELRELEQKKMEYILACGRFGIEYRVVSGKGKSFIWWTNEKTKKIEKQPLPDDFNIHDWAIKDMNETITSYVLEYKEDKKTWKLELPVTVYEHLESSTESRKEKKVSIHNLVELLRECGYSGRVSKQMKKIWAYLVKKGEEVTKSEIKDKCKVAWNTVDVFFKTLLDCDLIAENKDMWLINYQHPKLKQS